MRTGLYARVSTTDQSCELQLQELRAYAARRGWDIAGEYVDTGWSGAKASRPELDRKMDSDGDLGRQESRKITWALETGFSRGQGLTA